MGVYTYMESENKHLDSEGYTLKFVPAKLTGKAYMAYYPCKLGHVTRDYRIVYANYHRPERSAL